MLCRRVTDAKAGSAAVGQVFQPAREQWQLRGQPAGRVGVPASSRR